MDAACIPLREPHKKVGIASESECCRASSADQLCCLREPAWVCILRDHSAVKQRSMAAMSCCPRLSVMITLQAVAYPAILVHGQFLHGPPDEQAAPVSVYH